MIDAVSTELSVRQTGEVGAFRTTLDTWMLPVTLGAGGGNRHAWIPFNNFTGGVRLRNSNRTTVANHRTKNRQVANKDQSNG